MTSYDEFVKRFGEGGFTLTAAFQWAEHGGYLTAEDRSWRFGLSTRCDYLAAKRPPRASLLKATEALRRYEARIRAMLGPLAPEIVERNYTPRPPL